MVKLPPKPTRIGTLFPYTTLSRSHWPLVDRVAGAFAQFVLAKRLGVAAALDDVRHDQLRTFESGETSPTLLALTTTADLRAIFSKSRVNDAGVRRLAERTLHASRPLADCLDWKSARRTPTRLRVGTVGQTGLHHAAPRRRDRKSTRLNPHHYSASPLPHFA